MGVHVSLYYADGREWPEWDCCRHARDNEFAIGANKPSERWILSIAKDGTYPEDRGYRPADFAAWREEFVGEDKVNSERFAAALDFLEANPGSYIMSGW